MDPDTYYNIHRYLSCGGYPQGAKKTEKYAIRRRASVYTLDEGAIYYKKGKRLVVYDKEKAKQIFYEYHISATEDHRGIVKTRNAVCKRFYWPGITNDINKWDKRLLWKSMVTQNYFLTKFNKTFSFVFRTSKKCIQVGECLECQNVIAIKLETDSIPIEAGECIDSEASVFTVKEETDPIPLQAGEHIESQATVSTLSDEKDSTILQAAECMESQASVSTLKDEKDPTILQAGECLDSQTSVFIIKDETEETDETEIDPTPLQANQPFEFVGMYISEKVAKTKTGNRYICVMVDYYTRWSEAFALPFKTEARVAGCVMKFFYRFGAPKLIFIDQRPQFVNKLNKELCKSLGGQHKLCAQYYPQTNKLFKKLNETVQRALSELVNQRPQSWDMYLDAMMFVLRTRKHITTEFSPFFLMFGIEARHPSEIPNDCKDGLMPSSF